MNDYGYHRDARRGVPGAGGAAVQGEFHPPQSATRHRHGGVQVGPDYHREYPETWGEHYHSYAREKPHAAAVGQAQEHLRTAVPGYSMPLPDDEEEAGQTMRHLLRRAGHPLADTAFVMRHPQPHKGISCTVRDHNDGDPQVGAALHPDRWDYGTLAHETAHLSHQHELGVSSGQGLSDEELHGPGFVEHFKRNMDLVGRNGGQELHEAYHAALGRIQDQRTRADVIHHEADRTTASQETDRWSFFQKQWDENRPEIARTKPVGHYVLHAEHPYDDGDQMIHALTTDGQYVGKTYFGEHPHINDHLEGAPRVHPEHRRRGLGTAMYNFAEELRHKPMAPGRGHSDDAAAFWRARQGHTASIPTKRLFGPTYGLDTRLFSRRMLRPDVRRYVLGTLNGFWSPTYGTDWKLWARVYLAGSEASEWTSPERQGNNDFDILIGIHYDAARVHVPVFSPWTDDEITDHLNGEFREHLIPRTDPVMIEINGRPEGPFSNTWYVNPASWDIRAIKPYAAFDITNNRWAVTPPHLPEWSIDAFPEGHALIDMGEAYGDLIKAIMAMPEPYKTQQGNALWEHLHSDRSRAFSPQGEGWYDPGNVIEKWLDQEGTWADLWELHHRATEDPSTLLAPADWSNDPRG